LPAGYVTERSWFRPIAALGTTSWRADFIAAAAQPARQVQRTPPAGDAAAVDAFVSRGWPRAPSQTCLGAACSIHRRVTPSSHGAIVRIRGDGALAAEDSRQNAPPYLIITVGVDADDCGQVETAERRLRACSRVFRVRPMTATAAGPHQRQRNERVIGPTIVPASPTRSVSARHRRRPAGFDTDAGRARRYVGRHQRAASNQVVSEYCPSGAQRS
jgi:hypothetical protein